MQAQTDESQSQFCFLSNFCDMPAGEGCKSKRENKCEKNSNDKKNPQYMESFWIFAKGLTTIVSSGPTAPTDKRTNHV